MPALTFVLPHWVYWCGLLLFPLFAMVMVRRSGHSALGRPSISVGYLTLVTAGFVGLHRFYVRSWLGLLYLIPFIGILYANGAGREARERLSRARNESMVADFRLEQLEAGLAQGREVAAAKLDAARETVATVQEQVAAATADLQSWATWAAAFAIAIAVMLAIDALLLPRLVRRQAERERCGAERVGTAGNAAPPPPPTPPDLPGTPRRPRPVAAVEAVSRFSGEFVAYWSVIAVFVYYYEVVARYVFNSPTNWAHESMFLMFGMQYLISGAYAYLNDSHVRVDIFYARLSPRGKAASDVATSLFFFIFAGTMLVTGWIFMMDSVRVWEVSFTEWAIQYWPVKITITLGAALILLQGLAKLFTDVSILARGSR